MAVFSGYRPFLTKGSTVNGVQNSFFEGAVNGFHYLPDPADVYSSTALATAGTGVAAILDKKTTAASFGTELLTNGNFSQGSTGWTLGSGWSIASNTATANIGVGVNLDRQLTTTLGKTYCITYTISTVTSGNIRVRLTGTSNINGLIRGSAGTYTEFLYATSSNSIFRLSEGGSGFVGSITNVSVKEVSNNTTLQSSTSLQPLLGRAPRSRRNNMSNTVSTPTVTNGSLSVGSPITVGNATIPMWDFTIGNTALPTVTGVSRARPDLATVNFNYLHSVFVKPGTNRYIYFSSNFNGAQSNVGSKFRYDTVTDTVTSIYSGNVSNVFSGAQNLGNGIYRLFIRQLQVTNTSTKTVGVYCSSTSETTDIRTYISPTVAPDGVFSVGGWQSEIVNSNTVVPSNYQEVDTTGVVTTEAGVLSYPFVRFDLSDDRLDTVLQQAVTGDIIIAGRNGSIIEPVSYAANTTFQLGPTSYTGGTPGILRAIGDVVGYTLIGRSTTELERNKLMDFYKFRGAKGLLVPGPELRTATATVNGGWTESGGIVTAPGTTGTTDNVAFVLSSPTVAGRFYEVVVPNNMPANGFYLDFGTGTGS